MDLRQIERFISIVDSGSLSVAARKLRLSQPALSKSLRQLEAELDTRLVERGARGVRPTAAGRVFHARALSVSAELRRARDEIEEVTGGSAGQIAIGVVPGQGILNRVLPHTISTIVESRPALGVRVVSGTILELLPALRREELDLLLSVIDRDALDPSLEREVLGQDRMVFVVRPGHPLAAADRVALDDLPEFRWVLSEDAHGFWLEMCERLAEAGRGPRFAPLESNSVLFIKTVVLEAGLVGLLPASALDERERAHQFRLLNVTDRATSGPLFSRSLGFIYKGGFEPTPATRALMAAIRNFFREEAEGRQAVASQG
jgi:DNA-binding transcriptional LysR family regulator